MRPYGAALMGHAAQRHGAGTRGDTSCWYARPPAVRTERPACATSGREERRERREVIRLEKDEGCTVLGIFSGRGICLGLDTHVYVDLAAVRNVHTSGLADDSGTDGRRESVSQAGSTVIVLQFGTRVHFR